MAKRIDCSACRLSRHTGRYKDAANCRECGGKGYNEISECTAGKKWLTACAEHLEHEPMVDGWWCRKCKESGPWPKRKKN